MLKASNLFRLLSDPGAGIELKSSIRDAMPEFRRGLAIKGAAAPIQLSDDGGRFLLTSDHLINLCTWYLDGELDSQELEYCANALELSSNFQRDQIVENELNRLATPEIEGKITPDEIKKVILRLSGIS
jgi:hypothetical protein